MHSQKLLLALSFLEVLFALFRNLIEFCETSGLRHGVIQTFALLTCYAAYISTYYLTFQDSLSSPNETTTNLSSAISMPHC